MSKPVILLAFANYEQDPSMHLRGLAKENMLINQALQNAQQQGICEVITLPNADLGSIMRVFATKPVAVFHYAGHANDYELLLSESSTLHSRGLAEYLGQQNSLQLVVLNACSTKGHVENLIKNGVKAIIATSNLINDQIAVEFAYEFYLYLGLGKSIFFAFNQYEARQKIEGRKPEEFYLPAEDRALFWKGKPDNTDVEIFPWFHSEIDEVYLKWNLADASQNPLFGLPPVNFARYDLPPEPFLYLQSYERKHAEIFFGRDYQIRELYDKVSDPLCPPVILMYGQSGVGKTSLMEAGLLPYFELTTLPVIARRNPVKGLTATLYEALQISDPTLTAKQVWMQKEQLAGGRPLVLVIDRVEEALIQPVIVPVQALQEIPRKIASDVKKTAFQMAKSLLNTAASVSGLSEDSTENTLSRLAETVKKSNPMVDALVMEPQNQPDTAFEQLRQTHALVYVRLKKNDLQPENILKQLPELKVIAQRENKPVAVVIQTISSETGQRKFFNPSLPAAAEKLKAKTGVATPIAPPAMPEDEFETFVEELKKIFGEPDNRPAGKIILIYRKEYHSEIDMRIKQAAVPRTRTFIEPLTKDGIQQAVTGLATHTRTKQQYKLTIEDSLPDIIANDLLADRESAIAPVLQILLTKMWDTAVKSNPENPEFTRVLYLNLKDEGILLSDFLQQKLSELSAHIPEVVESGFALEVLRSFVNPQGTVSKRKLSDLLLQFPNASAIVPGLAEHFKQLFLFGETPASDGSPQGIELSLSHDILAPVIREMYDNSDLPVQRANRIFKNKLIDWKKGNRKNLLDEADLNIVELSRQWLPAFNANEQELIDASIQKRNKQQRAKKQRQIVGFSMLGALVVATLVIGWLWRQAVDKTLLSLSYDLAFKSGTLLEAAPTKSFRLAEYAFRTHNNTRSFQAIWNAYHQSAMYSEFSGHTQAVNSAAFSPDGSRIVTASSDNSVIVWHVLSGDTVVYRTHARVNHASFSPDGTQILAALSNDTAVLWNSNRKIAAIFAGHRNEVRSALFSPDGSRVLTASWDNTARVWNNRGQLLFTLEGHDNYVDWAAWSHNGQYIVTTSADKTARIWKADGTPLHLLEGHLSGVNYAAFSPSDDMIITTSDDNTARLWSLDGNLLAVLTGHNGYVEGADFSPDGKTIATVARDFTIKLWNTEGQELKTIPCPHSFIYSVVYSPFCSTCTTNGNTLLTASEDNTARIWYLTGNRLDNQGNEIHSVAASPNGRYLVTTGRNKKAVVWDAAGKKVADLLGHNGYVFTAAFSPDGQQIVTASADSTAMLWNVYGRSLLTLRGHTDAVTGAVFSNNDQLLIATSSRDNTAKLWSSSGQLLRTFARHAGAVESVNFSPDDKLLVTAGRDSLAIVWRVKDASVAAILKGHEAPVMYAAFSDDGKYIVTAGRDKTARIWTADGRELQTLAGHSGVVNFATFLPQSNRIVTASADKTARIWNLNGEELITLSGHTAAVEGVAFAAQGSRLVTASKDGTARIWLIEPDSMIADANKRHLAFLTAQDMKKYDVEDNDRRLGINRLGWLFSEGNEARMYAYAQYYTLLARQKRSSENCRTAGEIYTRLFEQTHDSLFLHKKTELDGWVNKTK
ncbi:CHAT domain-containing protein [Sphingobacteriales bacterium UPWRP_1]|nr:hypothetical protein B6N25_11235 [Sphingobacteriales bacterium TSM_CSS]PSJ77555.1 CHAT domain-containing protein [Sphingobacteriales bacterium UPWRP_1]